MSHGPASRPPTASEIAAYLADVGRQMARLAAAHGFRDAETFFDAGAEAIDKARPRPD